ncbi:hypothetical protein GCM10010331_45090 [Streptomyces xanthochromogenes]|uniref:T4 family baseplate hub assembly chaperone n=1 Tax=Streptomyces xanthochromogenes TaxID=67384 RepID=UPI0016720AB3|nr:hypothetical protein [Streptomyces xanthochromogenes]GHB52463.1 hypothetical protein GCM10010331_45090 [Streptomyces xanthochromogenes]
MSAEKLAYNWNFDDQAAGPSINPMENATAANAAMQQVLVNSTGPAPAPPLPSGSQVPLPVGIEINGTLMRDAEIRELTGADEEKLSKVSRSSVRFFDTLLKLGVVSLGNEPVTPALLKGLYVADRDALMLAIRIATFGPQLELVGVSCPTCRELVDFTVDLSTVELRGLPAGETRVELRDGRWAYLRFPTGEDQEHILAAVDATSAETNTALLERCVTYIESPAAGIRVPGSADVARRLGIADRRTILMYLADHAPGPQLMSLSTEHEACGEEVPLPLTVADIFLDL